jgi:hypothetical protein
MSMIFPSKFGNYNDEGVPMPTENKPAEPFQREDRYIVIKRSDIERLSPGDRRVATRQLRDLHEELFKAGAPARSFVVVEDDWPEYHLAWAMIEHRMAGKPVPDFNLWRRADELQQRLNAADQRIDELTIPDGYCVMPTRLTAENGAKALLLGEFKLEVTSECPDCRDLDEPSEGCEICDGEGEYGQQHMIPWDQIKFIYSEAVKGLAKNPNTPL